jgi:hypothetical protein
VIGAASKWLGTVESVYVVAAGALDDDVSVRVDGVGVPVVTAEFARDSRPLGRDVAYHSFTFRTGHVHHVDVTSGGRSRGFDLDARTKAHGWVLVPFATPSQGGPCIVEEMAVYGDGAGEGKANLLSTNDGVIALPRSYDRTFEPAPALAKTRQGGPTSKWALRALDCAAFGESADLVPYRTGTVAAK